MRPKMQPIAYVHTINKATTPIDVHVRITQVNPDTTVTIEDAIGHVWFGVKRNSLRDLTPATKVANFTSKLVTAEHALIILTSFFDAEYSYMLLRNANLYGSAGNGDDSMEVKFYPAEKETPFQIIIW